ncbi:MAG TPA: DUF4407 domain-containing protein [Mycobacterium sp.]|nr:DUF4407 domain-containing protein [Mycobacterium sp.]
MSRLTGVVVLIGAAFAWLVATVAVAEATDWSVWAILPLTLLFAVLVGAVTLAIAVHPGRGRAGVFGRGAVGVLVGVVVGELAALVLFSGSIDSRLDEQAARNAAGAPAVAQASASLDRLRDERAALDNGVEQARVQRDQALVVARCEYNPSAACPQTRITGVPGTGPETRTANQILADTQRELDNAVAMRDRQAPGLDTGITTAAGALDRSRAAAMASADRGLGARWVAMHDHTLANPGAMVLWAVTLGFCILLSLLPLILKLLRPGSKSARAELDADTTISVKRAEVRAKIENMWAEQQLASTRLAIEAQNQIDREMQRRRVAEALDSPVRAELSPDPEPEEEDMYLPIEAEARAASAAALPARVEDEPDSGPPLLQTAARWIRPLVPPIVARAIDTTAHPLRTARQVFEEVEEITFTLKRTHKVTVGSEESVEHGSQVSDRGEPAAAPRPHPRPAAIEGQRQLPAGE